MEKLVIHSALKQYSVVFNDSSLLPEEIYDFYFVDFNVYTLWKDLWIDKKVFVLPAGEKCKELETYVQCIRWLEYQNGNRSSKIIAVGGGATLDCIGFIASTYLRGIEWMAIPTTFLGMVDACIGGKVGLNFRGEKNRIGQFYPPLAVWINTQWLNTLPKRELQSGYAEVIKTAALISGAFWNNFSSQSILSCIKNCLYYKAIIVEQDEFEKKSDKGRFVLNAGHTIAHGLEALYPGYYLHGEAVSIGLIIETEFGVTIGYSDPSFYNDLKQKLKSKALPIDLPNCLDRDKFIKIILNDKKGDRMNLTLSMISVSGKCKIISDISIELFKNFLKEKIGADKI